MLTSPRYIFAGHVAEYMETLADDDEERYKSQFQKYIDEGVDGELIPNAISMMQTTNCEFSRWT